MMTDRLKTSNVLNTIFETFTLRASQVLCLSLEWKDRQDFSVGGKREEGITKKGKGMHR